MNIQMLLIVQIAVEGSSAWVVFLLVQGFGKGVEGPTPPLPEKAIWNG